MCVCDASGGGGAGLLFIFSSVEKRKRKQRTRKNKYKKTKKKILGWTRSRELITRRHAHRYAALLEAFRANSCPAGNAVLLLCGNWGYIIITEIYPMVTRTRGNSAFCTVIGFTVTGDYELLRNVLHGIGECVLSR